MLAWGIAVNFAPQVLAEGAAVAEARGSARERTNVSPVHSAMLAVDDPRDVAARRAFASGDYSRALALFVELFASYPEEVIYYRNIGRCYQSLGEPTRAIASFQNYQRRAGVLSAAEAAEIQRYIEEMRQLARVQRTASEQRSKEREGAARRRYRLKLGTGIALLAAAPVLAGVGIAMGVAAQDREHQLAKLCSPETPCQVDDPRRAELLQEGEQAERRQWWLFGSAGAALVAGTIVLVLARKSRTPFPPVAVGVSFSGSLAAALSLRGAF